MAAAFFRHRTILFCLSAAVALFSLAGLARISFDTSFQAFLEKDNPNLVSLLEIQENFSSSENNALIIVAPESGRVFEAELLSAMARATEEAWQLPYIKNVISLANTPRIVATAEGLELVNYIDEEGYPDEAGLGLLEKEALNDPKIVGQLISEDGATAAIYLDFEIPPGEHANSSRFLGEKIKAIGSGIDNGARADLYYSGNVFFDHALYEVMVHDLLYLFPLVCLVVVLFLSFILRSVLYTLITFSVTFLSILLTIGISGWLGIALNTVSVLCTMVIISVGVADNIHFFNSYIDNRHAGMAKLAAIEKSLSSNFVAMFITSFTTAIGFLTMNFSESPPFHDLGNLTAIGVMADFWLTVALVPAIVAWIPDNAGKFRQGRFFNTRAIGQFVLDNNRAISMIIFPLSLLLILCIPKNELNDDSLTWFDKDTEFRQSTDYAAEHLSGLRYIVYTLKSPSEHGINDPGFLLQVESLVDWYAQQPEVTHQHHYLHFLKDLNKKFHDDDGQWYRLPDTVEGASQSLLLLELGVESEEALNMFYSFDKSSLRLVVSLKNLTNREYIGLEQRAHKWMLVNVPDIASRGASIPIMFAKVGQDNLERMVYGGVLATLLITIVIALALRSVRYGLLSIIPNALPIAVTYGVWGLLVGELNLAAAVMFSVSIGVIVDDTVHFIYRYLNALREQGLNHDEAILHVFEKVGGALLTTTLILGSGLFILSFSSFTMSATIGAMVTLTIIFGLFFDFFCLPVLLALLQNKNNRVSAG